MTKAQRLRAYFTWFHRALIETEFAAEMDAGFDGGEFSGPAHARAFNTAQTHVMTRLALTDDDVSQAVHEYEEKAYNALPAQ